jgi:tetratricopeptide (TPR) repeat protein
LGRQTNVSVLLFLVGVFLLWNCASESLHKPATQAAAKPRAVNTPSSGIRKPKPESPAKRESALQQPDIPIPTQRDMHRRHVVASKEVVSQEEMLVSTLLTRSSAAKNVRSCNNPQVISLYAKAKSYHEAATQAGLSGDTERQLQLLSKAKLSFFQAARLAVSDTLKQTRARDNYRKRMESAQALLSALRRIIKEKHLSDSYLKELRQEEDQLHKADKVFSVGNLSKARKILDSAFVAVKDSVIKLRNGDTLVRSLNFSSPEEEYRYELDRNETHKLLLTVLFSGKNSRLSADPRVRENLKRAGEFRRRAEQQAKSSEYKAAIKLLEKSTQMFIRAIREAGIYIPG